MIQLVGLIRFWPVVLVIIAFFAVSFVVMLIREDYHEKKARSGEDMNRLKEMLKEVVPDLENYVPAYGIWEMEKYYGSRPQTSFWYYAIAFNDDRIHVVKLNNVKGRLEPVGNFVVEKSQVGMVNGGMHSNWMSLYDKKGQEIMTLIVAKENLRDDKDHPVNIIQTEAAEAFEALVAKWTEDINKDSKFKSTGIYGALAKK